MRDYPSGQSEPTEVLSVVEKVAYAFQEKAVLGFLLEEKPTSFCTAIPGVLYRHHGKRAALVTTNCIICNQAKSSLIITLCCGKPAYQIHQASGKHGFQR